MNDRAARLPGEVLLHPVTLASIALWWVNDHVLKHQWPSWFTGKLSDVACLVACPLLVLAAVELAQPLSERQRNAVLVAAIALFGAIMVTIRIFEPAAFAYRWGLGAVQWPLHAVAALADARPIGELRPVRLAMDPTDIACLPALIVPWLLARSRPSLRT